MNRRSVLHAGINKVFFSNFYLGTLILKPLKLRANIGFHPMAAGKPVLKRSDPSEQTPHCIYV